MAKYKEYDKADKIMNTDKFFHDVIEIEMEDDSLVKWNYVAEPVLQKNINFFVIYTEHNSWHRYFWTNVKRYRFGERGKSEKMKYTKWINGGAIE